MRRAVAYVAVVVASGLIASAANVTGQPQEAPRFGGSYAQLDARRRALVDNWVSRFSRVTGQNVGPAAFYDTFVKVSAKTTFDAITHALMTTALTDAAGNRFGDALQVVEQIDEVRGQATGTPGDHQFRMFVRLTPDALDTLARSRQFVRRGDNTFTTKAIRSISGGVAARRRYKSPSRWTSGAPTSTSTTVRRASPWRCSTGI
jgi:hypothetical protein